MASTCTSRWRRGPSSWKPPGKRSGSASTTEMRASTTAACSSSPGSPAESSASASASRSSSPISPSRSSKLGAAGSSPSRPSSPSRSSRPRSPSRSSRPPPPVAGTSSGSPTTLRGSGVRVRLTTCSIQSCRSSSRTISSMYCSGSRATTPSSASTSTSMTRSVSPKSASKRSATVSPSPPSKDAMRFSTEGSTWIFGICDASPAVTRSKTLRTRARLVVTTRAIQFSKSSSSVRGHSCPWRRASRERTEGRKGSAPVRPGGPVYHTSGPARTGERRWPHPLEGAPALRVAFQGPRSRSWQSSAGVSGASTSLTAQ